MSRLRVQMQMLASALLLSACCVGTNTDSHKGYAWIVQQDM